MDFSSSVFSGMGRISIGNQVLDCVLKVLNWLSLLMMSPFVALGQEPAAVSCLVIAI